VTSLFPTVRVCHSANSKDNGKIDVFDNQKELAKVWQYAGTLKNTAAADPTNHSLATAIGLIEEALNILKKL